METDTLQPTFIPFKCPVCNGFTTVNWGKALCKACNGKGYILVPNLKEKKEENGKNK